MIYGSITVLFLVLAASPLDYIMNNILALDKDRQAWLANANESKKTIS